MKSLRDHRTFSKFIENLHEGIYITSWDGTILDANPAFLRVFRVNTIHEVQLYRAGELLVDPRQRRRELEILGREGWVRDFELQIRRPDGEVRTVLDTAYSVTDPSSGETLFHGLMIDISRRKQLESRLREQAIRDELTGAYNRRYLAELEDNSEAKHPQAVVIANVQEFRRFNVLHGHQAGDEALVTVSRLLAQEIQAEDVLVRLGSDEFLLLLSDSDETGTEELSRRLQRSISSRVPVAIRLGWAVRTANEPLEHTIARASVPRLVIGSNAFIASTADRRSPD